MHSSIAFSLQLMHLPDASAVKNCSPFLKACFVLAEWQSFVADTPELWICPHCMPGAEWNAWVPLLWPRQDRAKSPWGLGR